MNLYKNIQFQQFINLLLLLYIANINGYLQTSWLFITTLGLYALIFEFTLNWYFENKTYIPYSAIITAFGVILMVGWLKWYIPFIIIALALLQKKLTIDGKHIFNPSNFAVVVALLIFYPKALPILGELGFKGYYTLVLVLILAIIILIRVNRLTISLSFILFYILFEYIVLGHSDPLWHIDDFLTKFFSTSFIVYTLFMLTDPITTPQNSYLQILFGAIVSAIVVTLDYTIGIRTWNLFLGLFLSSILVVPLYRNTQGKELKKYLAILLISIVIVTIISLKKPLYFTM